MRLTILTTLIFICGLLLDSTGRAAAKVPFRMLFIGNSLTYFPNQNDAPEPSADHPMLPTLLKSIIEAKHPELEVSFASSTPGGWSFEKHFAREATTALLKKPFDIVVLQGSSLEALQLSQWFIAHGYPTKESFLVNGQMLAELSPVPHEHIYFFANWAYHPRHPFFAQGFAGGAHWYGVDWNSITDQIESSYEQLAEKLSAHVVSVGRVWRKLHETENALVTYDDLFWDLKSDFLHPGFNGTYLNSLIFYRRIFHDSALGAPFDAKRISKIQAEYLQKFVDEQVPLL